MAEAAPRPRFSLPVAYETVPDDPWGDPATPDYAWPDASSVANVVLARVAGAARPSSFDAGDLSLARGDAVVIQTDRGSALASVASPPRRQLVTARPPPRVIRRANPGDLAGEAKQRLREAEAARVAAEVADRMGLACKILRAEIPQGQGRTVVCLSSDDHIDLRDFVRELSAVLRGRIDLRHVGARDAARIVGGVGPCGLQLCCNTFLTDFAPVSIRHAKDQGLALNPQRVSGVCGKLMCCLVYEEAFYRQQRALFPKQGKRVVTPKGEARVRDVDVLARTVRVQFADGASGLFGVDDLRPAAPLPGSE